MFTSAKVFFARLTEIEKAAIRCAQTPERLEYLFDTRHSFEFDLKPAAAKLAFIAAVQMVRDEFITKSAEPSFGLTWKF